MNTIALACCALFDSHDRLLLVHRNTPERVHWELPGGKVDAGESPEAAAARELEEELSVRVSSTRLLTTTEFAQDSRNFVCHIYTAEYSGLPALSEDLFDALDWFSQSQLNVRTDLSLNAQCFLTLWKQGFTV
ncbi:MAG: 8-oxo-dGTP diphosphatase [candidate division WS6 bacterium OLB20]|uniref:8-oxo-dGTP diphosphatase n=1 Tax=candidate division WS6 bacterium OLB20 TaxID=1617426 RepID=A0A136LXJ9_9BACT|nr:MAG: 8-oxo-dGTP diphosphatase [candidate division WS6 bacterium OLB20]